MYDLIIENGHLITPAGILKGDLAIDDEVIAAIGTHLNGERTLDAGGCYVIPGGVDAHVHLQMELNGRISSDTFETGTIAAACGGTTSVIDFTAPQPGQFLMDSLRHRRRQADEQVAVDYGLHMTIPTWHGSDRARLYELSETVDAGCPTFKLYQAYHRMELDDVSLYRVMSAIGDVGGKAVLHSETGPLLEQFRTEALEAGHLDPIWHERTRPARLEATAIHRAAEIAHAAGCPLHVLHLGCTEAVAEIVDACLRGVDLTAETCPQYLVLSAEEHLDGQEGYLYICAPPLRSKDDQEVMWTALADGDLQMVTTDHCPWSRAEKEQPASFAHVPGGVPSIESRLALIHHFGVIQGCMDVQQWIQTCCTNPARLMGFQQKGALLPGNHADVVLFDPSREKTITANSLHEAADWTPYAGMKVRGWPRTVLLRGQVIVLHEEYAGTPGQGRFIRRFLT